MALLRRRPPVPAASRPPLHRDERVLGWSDSDSGVLVATNLGLWLPDGFVGWHLVHKATWDGSTLAVTAAAEVASREDYVVVADLAPVSFRLAGPGDLPHQVRARVTRSVGYTGHHPLPGGGGARVAARRVPGVDGLRWTVRYDPGVDPDDPVVAAATAHIVDKVRE
jgi:hypothetical protein